MRDDMKFFYLLACTFFLATLAACQSTSSVAPKQSITFIDSSKFDQEMSSSLSSSEVDVKVFFYNPVTPNQIPPRVEKWLSEVDSTGGKISIVQPSGELTPKDPMMLFGLFSSLWAYFKTATGISDMANLKASVKDRDAVIQLERNKQGEIIIDKIIFPIRAQK